MAKKFVRGVTGIEDIESYDKTLTNVNDILSDGQDTYVHTKKGKNESYYKLTDGLKSVISDNSDLITVTKDDTTNTVTIHPKHDAQKEQSIESTRGTVSIQKGGNGTSETTRVDTNPQKVLEHENLTANTDYVKIEHTSGENTTLINSNKISQKFETVDSTLLNKQNNLMVGAGLELKNNIISVLNFSESKVDLNNVVTTQYLKVGYDSYNLPKGVEPYGILTVVRIDDIVKQTYQTYNNIGLYIRTAYNVGHDIVWTDWQKIVTQTVS